jgi:3-oxoacyl-[acyl-carrier protein] reductase
VSYPKSLEGNVALIIGGAGAIGAATCRMLANAGATVAITHRPGTDHAAKAGKVIEGLSGHGHAVFMADVADSATLLALRTSIEQRYRRLDILINAAGFTKPVPHADLEALTDELIDRMFQVNWRGQFATIRTFAPLLKASRDGVIVSISSIAAFTGIGSSIAYCAAKAGIDVMTKALASRPAS